MKNKRAKINPINNDNKCFDYTATLALNHKQIEERFRKNYQYKMD